MDKSRITILHANDIHGQLSFRVNTKLEYSGGISLLSGYVKKTREEGPTFFGICGDVLQEDVLGSDYKGTNTVELVNYLNPDCLTLGNHELDYGLAHALVFKECIRSPILCANLVVSKMNQTLFRPSMICEIGGVRILLIGVIPKGFYDKIASDEFCRRTLEYRETYDAIRREVERRRGRYDLLVLMSHYGIEGERALAQNMPEDLHVDLILGGHSHIDMDEAEVVNGILLAQSSYGTTHVGRFDLVVDTQGSGICEWSWQRVPLTDQTSNFDTGVDELADRVTFHDKKKRDDSVLCELEKVFEHKSRLFETDLGNMVADAFDKIYPVDFVILQSGSIRREECGPVVTQQDLSEVYPFDDQFLCVSLTGKEIWDSFRYLFSLKPDGSVMSGTFLYSKGFQLVVDAKDYKQKGCEIRSITLNGKYLDNKKTYRIGMTRNCMSNAVRYFSKEIDDDRVKLLSLSTYHDLVTWCLERRKKIKTPERGRFVLLNYEG